MKRTVITSSQKWNIGSAKELWDYRDLYRMYVKRNITNMYHQTLLGPLWNLLQPMLMTLVYVLVFGRIFNVNTDGVPRPLFFIGSMALWNYFSSCMNGCRLVFKTNARVFGKVYFPRLIVPLSVVTSNLMRLVIQLMLTAVLLCWYILHDEIENPVGVSVLMLPLLVIILAVYGMSWGLVVACLSAKYRDLGHLVDIMMQCLMYVTPILYPLSYVPEKYLQIVSLNPLTPVLSTFQHVLLGISACHWINLLYSIGVAIASLMLSIALFYRMERRIMDVV